MQIVKKARTCVGTRHFLLFDWADTPGWGFAFPADKDGRPVLDNASLRENYSMCLKGEGPQGRIVARGLKTDTWTVREPAVGRCSCGRRVELRDFTNTCACGLDYNSAGQQLAPRSQWGEETGEAPYECVGPFTQEE